MVPIRKHPDRDNVAVRFRVAHAKRYCRDSLPLPRDFHRHPRLRSTLKNHMKKWLRLVLLAGLWAPAVGAVDWSALVSQGCVSDFARVVDPATRSRVEAYCGAVEHSTGVEIALVTLPSLEGESIAEVAQAIYRGMSVGKEHQGQGILLLMAVRDRRVRLVMTRGLESTVAESRVLREMRPALRERDFSEAAVAAVETIGTNLSQARKVTMSASLTRRLRPGPFDWFPWPVLVGAMLLALGLMRLGGVRGDGGGTGGGLLPWLVRGRATSRCTWGANGSGGFGGYDSGDGGFGGFGGGDCSGSHASDW